jgi:hypothetical protein
MITSNAMRKRDERWKERGNGSGELPAEKKPIAETNILTRYAI